MQFLAVLDKEEIVFVDSMSYAVSGDEGGRLILVAWQFNETYERKALTDPVPCDVVFYKREDRDTQLRLVLEFRIALEQLDQRHRETEMPEQGAKILKLHQDG